MPDIKLHPLTRLFPEMSADEYTQLRNDIEQHGQREPVVLHDDKILDGRHRYKACRELGMTPKTRTLRNGSPLDFVISMNLKRRHLTESQKGMIAADVLPQFEKAAKKRQGTRTGKHPGKNARKSEPDHRARDDAAKAFSVSPRYVSDAKLIKKESPQLAKQVWEGKKTIPQAIREIRPKQKTELDTKASGWLKAFHDLFMTCNSVRDIGGIEKLMGGWRASDKQKIVNQIEHIEGIFSEWKSFLRGTADASQS